MVIFHNHIPRTSGEVINRSISKLTSIRSLIVKPTDIISKTDFYNKDFICGHLGQYPQTFLKDVISFSLVRDPYDQFISWFWLMFMQEVKIKKNGKEITGPEYLDKIFNDKKYIMGMSNMQSKFLTGTLDINAWNAHIHPLEKTKNDSCLINYKIDKSEIDNSLELNLVYLVENRQFLIEKINKLFLSNFKCDSAITPLNIPGHNRPKNHQYFFDMPKSWENKIKSYLEADYYLYSSVLNKNKNSGIIIL